MSIVIADLVARVHAEGVQDTAAGVKSIGDQSKLTADALQLMAEKMAAANRGQMTAAEALDILRRTGAQPTAAALDQVTAAAARAAAAVQQVATVSRSFDISPAFAALETSRSTAEEQRLTDSRRRQQQQFDALQRDRQAMVQRMSASQASLASGQGGGPTSASGEAEKVAAGWTASESSVVRFGAALVGVNLGISLAAGAARLVRDTIVGTVNAQLDWERSLVTVRGIYGDIGSQIIAASQLQAVAPGLTGSQQEFAQANLAASYLSRRYGLPTGTVTALTSSAAAASTALGYDEQQRRDLQARTLQFAEGGGNSLRDIGVEGSPLSIARRVGFSSEAALQAFTPAQLREIQTNMAIAGQTQFAIQGGTGQPGLLAQQAQLEKARTVAQSNLQTALEDIASSARVPTAPPPTYGGLGTAGFGTFSADIGMPVPPPLRAADVEQQTALKKALDDAQKAIDANAAALGDNAKRLVDANVALEKMGVSAGSAAARLLSFTGTLEDRYSIARGDVGAQAQAAVAARARSAIPSIGTTQGERIALANNTSYQQAYQNYVAQQAQEQQDNAIREHLQGIVDAPLQSNVAPEKRAGAQRALDQAQQLQPINARMNEAQQTGALVDIATAETQAKLQTISLTQQERQIQLIRETVDLRRLDVQQQQALNAATQNVIRAQQGGLASSWALSDAQYQGNLASSLAQQRMGRTLRGQDVSGLPSIDQLIQMNVNAQFATAEAGPAALQGARGVEMAQRTATSAGLAQELTAGQLQSADLANDLKNLADIPSQTGLQLELVGYGRDSLAVQKELRDLTKDLVRIMTGRPPSATSDQGMQDLSGRLADLIFGDGSSDIAIPAPSDLPGARRGPS